MQIIDNHFLKHKKNNIQSIIFNGPQGLLQGCAFNIQKVNSANLALVLSPNPMHKGTMNNQITNTIFNTFKELNFSVLKFNYRGIGESKGNIVNQEDIIDDALHALDWLINKCENANIKNPKIFIAGFSLGGWAALQCAMRRPEISNFISINTQFYTSEFNMLTPCPNGLIIQSTNDKLFSTNEANEFTNKLIKQKDCSIINHLVEDNHYLNHSIKHVEEYLKQYIKSNKLDSQLQNIKRY